MVISICLWKNETKLNEITKWKQKSIIMLSDAHANQ